MWKNEDVKMDRVCFGDNNTNICSHDALLLCVYYGAGSHLSEHTWT